MTNDTVGQFQKVREGEAVFFPLEQSVWDARQATKQRLLDGEEPRWFRVTYEELYFPHLLDRLLAEASQIKNTALSLGEKIIGRDEGAFNCAALWDTEHWDGILLHREGVKLICAYLPVLSKFEAEKEHAFSMKLAALAEEAGDMPLRIEQQITAGRWSLKRLLHDLSEQMEV